VALKVTGCQERGENLTEQLPLNLEVASGVHCM